MQAIRMSCVLQQDAMRCCEIGRAYRPEARTRIAEVFDIPTSRCLVHASELPTSYRSSDHLAACHLAVTLHVRFTRWQWRRCIAISKLYGVAAIPTCQTLCHAIMSRWRPRAAEPQERGWSFGDFTRASISPPTDSHPRLLHFRHHPSPIFHHLMSSVPRFNNQIVLPEVD